MLDATRAELDPRGVVNLTELRRAIPYMRLTMLLSQAGITPRNAPGIHTEARKALLALEVACVAARRLLAESEARLAPPEPEPEPEFVHPEPAGTAGRVEPEPAPAAPPQLPPVAPRPIRARG